MLLTLTRTILSILLCLVCTLCLEAQEKTLKYSYRHFGTENGLTQNSITDAVFDKNGHLWISIRTDNVFVYDGYRFTPCWFYKNGKRFAFKSATLICNSAGDIFIAHENGIHVRKQNTGNFEEVSSSVISRENEEITFLGEGNKHEIYFFRQGTIYQLQQSTAGSYAIEPVITPAVAEVYFERSVDGNSKISFFWFSKFNQPYCYLFDVNKKQIVKKISQNKGHVALAHFVVDSILYSIDNSFALYRSDDTTWKNVGQLNKAFFSREGPWLPNTFSNKSTGEIFVNSGHYVYKFNRDFTSPVEIANTLSKSVLSKGGITKILQQDAVHLWLFSTAEGFYQLDIRSKKFEHFKTEDGGLNFVRSIFKDERTGYVFSGLFYGGLVIYDSSGKIIKNIALPKINKDDKGGFCVNGILKLSNNIYLVWYSAGRAYLLNSLDWSLKSIINSGYAWRENYYGAIFDYAGFMPMEGNKFASGYRNCIYFFDASTQGIKIVDSIPCPLRRPEGFYYSYPWFYYAGIGSFYRYHTLTKKIDSIPIPFTTKVKWISRDKYNRLWVSTETGIAVLENNKPDSYRVVKTLTTDDGLPNNYIYVAEPDNKGKIWCSSNKGIFSINTNNYSVTGYSTVDGLQSEEFNTGAFFRDSSGNMFFGGINGANSFNPASMEQTSTDDKVHINYIGSAGTVLYQYPDKLFPGSIDLNYENPSLQLRFSALNYKTTGFNQYEYNLQLSGSNWVDNGSNNELQLVLTPGRYDIQIRLKNNPASAEKLTVYIAPPFYKTIWFLLAIFILLAAIIALIVNQYNKIRYRKKIAILEMQQKVQQEKERIGRDLHDNLGVQANAILHSSTLLDPEKENYKNVVADLQDTAKEMLLNLRETLWAMRTADVAATDLWLRIINFMKQMGRHYTAINFKVEGEAQKTFVITSNKALNIVLVVQEAVNNAVKHADASTIMATCTNDKNKCIITIKDDGKGFDMNTARQKTDNYGLQNMQERAISGNFTYSIETSRGKGTIITIGISS